MTNSDPRQRIEDFIHDCGHCIDEDRLEEWPTFFAEDCRYQIIDHENHALGREVGIMNCEGRAMLFDRVMSLRNANIYEPHRYRHLISGVRILDVDGDVYSVKSSYAVIRSMQEGDMSVFSAGRFLDKIMVSADQLLFKERIAVLDSSRVDTLIVIPI